MIRRRLLGIILRTVSVLVLFATLGYTGLAKLNDPIPASDFLTQMIAYRATWLIQWLAIFELFMAVWLISGVFRCSAGIAAAFLFAAFSVSHVFANTRTKTTIDCGCFGDSVLMGWMPDWGWIPFTLSLCAIAIYIGASPFHTKHLREHKTP